MILSRLCRRPITRCIGRGFTMFWLLAGFASPAWSQPSSGPSSSELVLVGGKIVTVDPQFRIVQAMRIRDNRIVALGTDEEILRAAAPDAQRIDLGGRTVLPGLIDSHVHAPAAAVYEFDHPQPTMNSIADVLQYIADRAKVVPEGQWIRLQQVFVTRLEERRFPTREELDTAAPHHPVIYRTGPDAALNSLALQLSGIDRDYELPAGSTGKIERDPQTGEPTGILRGASQHISFRESQQSPSFEQHAAHLRQLIQDYNSVGITSISDRSATDSGISLYQHLLDNDQLSCRVFLYYNVDGQGRRRRFASKS